MHNTTRIIPENQPSIGIIGGGQLGKMIAQEAKRMSLKVHILDPDPECPASSFADELLVADFRNQTAIRRLSELVDVLTYEIELADSDVLIDLSRARKAIHPAPETLKIIQNKYRQKVFLQENNLPVPNFALVEDVASGTDTISGRFPLVLKACENSYDGRGNRLIYSEEDIANAASQKGSGMWMVEEIIHFRKELSVIVARNESGQVSSFPVAENKHSEGILDTTLVPARISKQREGVARDIAEKTVGVLKGSGIFCVEMFLTANGEILINEIAPRPHNSGHYSIEGCSISQFEQHIRAILNLPLLKPRLRSPTVMVNILGPREFEGEYYLDGLNELLSIDGLKLHLYGKRISKPRRKLGHVTITAASISEAIDKSRKAKSNLRIVNKN
ncbi:MAG TPA: 5-(carboxyamino)imidazole ribonucleotide synthase [Nitrososphaeraceae archaeon]|nr:5-(carboxyamino)imidazole ribonucleotide synthase [Nitrososphaeraceae archaeon]